MDMGLNILKKISILEKRHLEKSVNLLKSLASKTGNYQDKEYIEPYNIILAASDIYYRENYHSDIFAYILKNKKNTINFWKASHHQFLLFLSQHFSAA
jgi:hypothetical protein